MKLHDPVDGLLLVDKASGITSHDVVALVRRRLGAQKVGHCGTLDPLATGLLLIVVGKATKIQDLLMSEDKEYVGTMKLGEITDSQDCDGQVIEQRSVEAIDPGRVKAAFQKFHGDFYQTPPMVSAIKRDGVPLYKLARQGKVVLAIRLPEIDFRVICSKGFYVRTYAHEIGLELGCGAHLAALRRTKSGRFIVEGSLTVEELNASTPEILTRKIIPLPDVSRMRGA